LADGTRKCVYARTRRGVLGRLRELRWQLANGLPVSKHKLHLRTYLEYWLEQSRSRLRHNTVYTLELSCRRVLGEIGDIPVRQLDPALVQGAYTRLRAKGLSDYSVLQAHRMLNRAMNQAQRWGLISRNPVGSVLPPKPRKREMTALTPTQLRRLMDGTRGDPFHPLWVVLGTAALRVGEALGLSWDDVDWANRRVIIHRALQKQVGAGKVFVPLKTARSYRTVCLSKHAVAALVEQRERLDELSRSPKWEEQGLVFPNRYGGPMDPGRPNHVLQPTLVALRLPAIRVHDLRHSAATSMLIQNVHPKVVQEMLGHSTVMTTLDTYSHVIPTLHVDAVQKLDELLDQVAVWREAS
jgi:integrase